MMNNPRLMTVENLADQQSLRRHMDEYHWLADAYRWDEWKQLWTEDAIFEVVTGGRVYKGRDDIVGIQSERLEARYERTQHFIVNCAFDVDGDHATGHGNLIFIGIPKASEPATNYVSGGLYNWEFKRTAAGWRSSHTRLEFLWELPGSVGLELFAGKKAR